MRFFRPLVAFSLTVSFAAVIGSGVHSSSPQMPVPRVPAETRDPVHECRSFYLYVHRGRRGHVQRAGGRHAGLRRGDWRRRGCRGNVQRGHRRPWWLGCRRLGDGDGPQCLDSLRRGGLKRDRRHGRTANCTAGDGGTNGGGIGGQSRCYGGAAVVAVELRTCERRPRRPRTSPVRPATRVSWSPAVAVAVAVPITPKVVREATLVTTP